MEGVKIHTNVQDEAKHINDKFAMEELISQMDETLGEQLESLLKAYVYLDIIHGTPQIELLKKASYENPKANLIELSNKYLELKSKSTK